MAGNRLAIDAFDHHRRGAGTDEALGRCEHSWHGYTGGMCGSKERRFLLDRRRVDDTVRDLCDGGGRSLAVVDLDEEGAALGAD